jgi:hypothetical protein
MIEANVLWRFRNKHEPLGEFGERLWSRIFDGCGMFYVPFKDLPAVNGKGPRLQGTDATHAMLPDFEVTGTGRRRRAYVDSKCKHQPVLYRNANELRHGIDRKNWEAYEAIGAINRQRCILAVAEIFEADGYEWSGSLLMQTLGKLGKPIAGFSNQDHMVYWSRRSFQQVAQASPSELWELANGTLFPDAGFIAEVESLWWKADPAIQSKMF